ncbi:MAG: hypothetical protein ACOC0P_03845, partial [Planctomycetota bacterium]
MQLNRRLGWLSSLLACLAIVVMTDPTAVGALSLRTIDRPETTAISEIQAGHNIIGDLPSSIPVVNSSDDPEPASAVDDLIRT